MFSNLEEILDHTLCFDISFQNMSETVFDNVLKNIKMKISESKKESII